MIQLPHLVKKPSVLGTHRGSPGPRAYAVALPHLKPLTAGAVSAGADRFVCIACADWHHLNERFCDLQNHYAPSYPSRRSLARVLESGVGLCLVIPSRFASRGVGLSSYPFSLASRGVGPHRLVIPSQHQHLPRWQC